MKTLHLLLAVFAFLLTSCFFKEPVFTEGFSKVNEALAGVWVAHGEKGDPRKNEFAVCVPIDTERYLLHYPAGEKGGFYYEARPLEIRGRTLLQLRTLATSATACQKRTPSATRFCGSTRIPTVLVCARLAARG
jgi:hypothetical protein